jgi:hypothetical protein
MSDALTYWTVEGAGIVFRVTPAVAQSIDRELTDGLVEFVRFRDLGGGACIYRRDRIFGLWESSPATRQSDRDVEALLKTESPPRFND